MTGDQNPAPGPAPGVPIKVTPEILLQVLTTPPASGPAPFPAVPVDLPAPADIANGALFAAGNSGVPGDVESSGLEDLDRRAHAADAVQKFSANEADAAQQFQGVGAQAEAQGATQMMQQAVSGAALWKLMERARQVGLHVFSTRNSANWATMPMDPWVKSQTSAKVAQLYMDNDPQNRINRSVRAQTLPPGRGLLVGADGDVEGILVGYPSVPGEQ